MHELIHYNEFTILICYLYVPGKHKPLSKNGIVYKFENNCPKVTQLPVVCYVINYQPYKSVFARERGETAQGQGLSQNPDVYCDMFL